jgi:MYXO-CTERM domain-containing protein
MPVTCDFYGSYYQPEPWGQACAVDVAVPEGCPIHFVTGTPINPAYITAERVAANGTATDTPNTATVIGTELVSFSVMDVSSCDCHQTSIGVEFQHVQVDVPAAVAGESVRLSGISYQSGAYEVQITAAGPCPAPEWPTEYHAALACDRCPEMDSDGDGIPDPDDPHDDSAGCAVGGDPSVILVGLALLPFVRRRRAKILSSE